MKGKSLVIIALLILVTASVSSYALFKIRKSGVSNLSAAKWSVKLSVDSTELTENTVVTLSDVNWINDMTDVANNKIAPGSYTTFNILIDASETETSVDYRVRSSFNIPNFEVTIGDNQITSLGTIDYSSNDNDMKLLIPVTVKWLGSASDNQEKDNTDLELMNSTLEIPIEVVVAQKISEFDPPMRTFGNIGSGQTVNARMKQIAGNSKTGTGDKDAYIKNFKRVSVIPNQYRNVNYIISTDDSENEVYMWFENGTIYFYSKATHIKLDSDSSYLFAGLAKLTTLDLTGFDTSDVVNMSNMFKSCTNLKTINLSSFDTSNVENMSSMFNGCENLQTLNLSNFNTSSCKNMSSMFYNNKKLTYLDISSFNTSKVTTMSFMFYNLYELGSLDLGNFNTENVSTFESMFNGCKSLTHLNLSNFNIRNDTDMSSMFTDCYSLKISNIITKDNNIVNQFYNYIFQYIG